MTQSPLPPPSHFKKNKNKIKKSCTFSFVSFMETGCVQRIHRDHVLCENLFRSLLHAYVHSSAHEADKLTPKKKKTENHWNAAWTNGTVYINCQYCKNYKPNSMVTLHRFYRYMCIYYIQAVVFDQQNAEAIISTKNEGAQCKLLAVLIMLIPRAETFSFLPSLCPSPYFYGTITALIDSRGHKRTCRLHF